MGTLNSFDSCDHASCLLIVLNDRRRGSSLRGLDMFGRNVRVRVLCLVVP